MRTFVAIEISNNDILQKISSLQKSIHFKAKPVKINQIHFTLQFLGEIDQEKCEKVQDVLNTITFSQFDLSLKGVGGFPNLKNPRVIWIGIDKKGGGRSKGNKKYTCSSYKTNKLEKMCVGNSKGKYNTLEVILA